MLNYFTDFLQLQDVQYMLLFTVVLIVPKLLLRFRVPVALTALALGMVTSLGLGWFQGDQLLLLLSRLGITSLFLFAGMEVDTEVLKENASALSKHVLKATGVVFVASIILYYTLGLNYRPALVLALGLMTPSTGFILSTLKAQAFKEQEEYWIRSKAIAKEIVALFLLFVVLQSDSIEQLLTSTAVIMAMILILPAIFRFFLKRIAPYAPDSEVAFLVLIALVCGVITKKIGAYYLVGAFIVGMTAGRFAHFVDDDNKGNSSNTLASLASFFTIFIPFYFYKAGLGFSRELFMYEGFQLGMIFLLVFVPIRVLSVFSTMHFFLKEFWEDRMAIAMNLLPTLIFGLVIAEILNEEFQAPPNVVSGLVIYTIVTSIIPAVLYRKQGRKLGTTNPLEGA